MLGIAVPWSTGQSLRKRISILYGRQHAAGRAHRIMQEHHAWLHQWGTKATHLRQTRPGCLPSTHDRNSCKATVLVPSRGLCASAYGPRSFLRRGCAAAAGLRTRQVAGGTLRFLRSSLHLAALCINIEPCCRASGTQALRFGSL